MVKKKKGGKVGVEMGDDVDDGPEMEFLPEHWVTLNIKLVTWDHLNFNLQTRTSTRLFAIHDAIAERHGGSVQDICLYKHQVHQRNAISNLGTTLGENGITGGPLEENVQCVLWYDFKPHTSDCPLLLSSPREQTENPHLRLAKEKQNLAGQNRKAEEAAQRQGNGGERAILSS